jgi:hypothetical protein
LARGRRPPGGGRLVFSDNIAGRAAQSRRAHGSVDAEGLALLSLFTLRLTAGRLAELVPALQALHQVFGAMAADPLALALDASGRRAEAERIYRSGGWPRPDFFQVLLIALRGMAAVAVGARDDAPAIRERLLPFADQLAGGGTGSFIVGPVGQVLGDLALLLGRPDEAREHYQRALDLCRRIRSPIWAETASASLRKLS